MTWQHIVGEREGPKGSLFFLGCLKIVRAFLFWATCNEKFEQMHQNRSRGIDLTLTEFMEHFELLDGRFRQRLLFESFRVFFRTNLKWITAEQVYDVMKDVQVKKSLEAQLCSRKTGSWDISLSDTFSNFACWNFPTPRLFVSAELPLRWSFTELRVRRNNYDLCTHSKFVQKALPNPVRVRKGMISNKLITARQNHTFGTTHCRILHSCASLYVQHEKPLHSNNGVLVYLSYQIKTTICLKNSTLI